MRPSLKQSARAHLPIETAQEYCLNRPFSKCLLGSEGFHKAAKLVGKLLLPAHIRANAVWRVIHDWWCCYSCLITFEGLVEPLWAFTYSCTLGYRQNLERTREGR